MKFSDPNSLKNLALTGPRLYTFIKPHEFRYNTGILMKTIGPELLPLAVARLKAESTGWRFNSYNERPESVVREIENFIDHYLHFGLNYRSPNSVKINFSQAVQLLDFHEAAIYYARTLSQKALRSSPREIRLRPNGTWLETLPATPSYAANISAGEAMRFKRAMYIFQMACALFPDDLALSRPLRPVMLRFFQVFAPWVNQQVRCIETMFENHLYNGKSIDTSYPTTSLTNHILPSGRTCK